MGSNLSGVKPIIEDLLEDPVEQNGHIYHPIPFDEFNELTTSSNAQAAYRKWELLTGALPNKDYSGYRVLDIGANAGFYSYQFAKHGAIVDAFEPAPRYAQLGKKITAIYDLPIEWHARPFDESFLGEQDDYDVTLMLSVFQWMAEGNTQLESATETLRAVAKKTRYLFFELGCNGGKSSIQVSGSGLRWISKLLNNATDYDTIAYLGSVRAWNFRDIRYQFVCTSEAVNLSRWQMSATRMLRVVGV